MPTYLLRILRVLIAAAVTTVCLGLAALGIRQAAVTRPLVSAARVPGVITARYIPPGAWSSGSGSGTLRLSLANGVDLSIVLASVRARATQLSAVVPQIAVAGPGQNAFAPLAQALTPAIVQALVTGQYLPMSRAVEAMAKTHGASAQLAVEPSGAIDLTLTAPGRGAYYAVFPDQAPDPAGGGGSAGG